MNLSMRWLSDFVTLSTTPREFAEKMTMSGSKVEGYSSLADEIDRVVVGQIHSIEKHPNADKLVVCQVNIGHSDLIQIVTGATNLKVKDIVPVALDGSTLPGGKKIKRGKLRGMESNGMLCSLSELSLSVCDFPYAVEEGIFVLQEENPILGQSISSLLHLDDITIEFEITSNRPDCLSVIGLAREAAATYQVPLKVHTPNVKSGGGNIAEHLKVEVQNEKLCPRYMARMVKHVKIAPSPLWMRERLRASGVRPINNLVDITNYVMLEYGQPMHAFDYRGVENGHIVVRGAKEGESITTLEGEKHPLSPDMLIIADEKKPIGIAGVMGGELSGVDNDTQTIILESACFLGPSVRLTAKALGLRTESSSRFEKGLDTENCAAALERACELVELLGAGQVLDGTIDVDHSAHAPFTLPLETQWINDFLGIALSETEMVHILEKIDFQVKGGIIQVPPFRQDVRHKADVAEEIARFYGYNKIHGTIVRGVANGALTPRQHLEQTITETLVAQGCYEIMTYTFTSPQAYEKAHPFCKESIPFVRIQNPLGEERSVMRTEILPSMLETLSKNYKNRNASAKLFEVGRVYHSKGATQQPDESDELVIGLYGDSLDFFSLKGILTHLFEKLRLKPISFSRLPDHPVFHPGRSAQMQTSEGVLGVLGEIHPLTAANYGLEPRTYAAVLSMDMLCSLSRPDILYSPLPKYPAISRDLALIADQATPAATIEAILFENAGSFLESLSLFDLYEGDRIAAGTKNLAYRLTFRSSESTLTDEEIDQKIQKILKKLAESHIYLRS